MNASTSRSEELPQVPGRWRDSALFGKVRRWVARYPQGPTRQDSTAPIWSGPLPQATGRQEGAIRVFDMVTSVLLLMMVWPLLLMAALLVKMTSPGPVIYRQERVGRHRRVFTLYKLRTMRDGAERDTGPVWAAAGDGRITPVGRVLRSTRIDELPQLFNVLRGEMSLVGPRPERPCFVAQFAALQGLRLAVKPGLTGLAQIRGPYSLRPEQKARYDALYVQNRSLRLNTYLVLATIPVVLLRRGWR